MIIRITIVLHRLVQAPTIKQEHKLIVNSLRRPARIREINFVKLSMGIKLYENWLCGVLCGIIHYCMWVPDLLPTEEELMPVVSWSCRGTVNIVKRARNEFQHKIFDTKLFRSLFLLELNFELEHCILGMQTVTNL